MVASSLECPSRPLASTTPTPASTRGVASVGVGSKFSVRLSGFVLAIALAVVVLEFAASGWDGREWRCGLGEVLGSGGDGGGGGAEEREYERKR